MASNKEYLELFISPLFECINYKPKFGSSSKSKGYSLDEFLQLYGSDPFYSWIGLDSPYMFKAHKAAGCMTSIYRQIGTGCERLFRQILIDSTKYSNESSAEWSYPTKTKSGKSKILKLDGRLELSDINEPNVKNNVKAWIANIYNQIDSNIDPTHIKGAVFEVRQGYKSKDSKRQNADIDNASVAHSYSYLPVFAIFSSQIDEDIALRYKNNRCCILDGNISNDSTSSIFAFCKDILGYDLEKFFEDNSDYIRHEVRNILEKIME